jgi:hypothetical protein
MASAAYQDLAPDPFKPGEASPEAAVVKFAQIVLTANARRRQDRLREEFQSQQIRNAEMTAAKLTREADPNYISPALRETMRHNLATEGNAAATQDRLNEPKTATPRALMTLTRPFGEWKAGDQVDPAEYSRVAAAARAQQAAKERDTRKSHVANARYSIDQLKAASVAGQDAAEAVARTTFDGLIRAASEGKGSTRRAALANLKLPQNTRIDPLQDHAAIEKLRQDWIATARKTWATRYERETAGKRATWQRIVDEEANVPADLTSGPDEVEEKIRRALEEAGR